MLGSSYCRASQSSNRYVPILNLSLPERTNELRTKVEGQSETDRTHHYSTNEDSNPDHCVASMSTCHVNSHNQPFMSVATAPKPSCVIPGHAVNTIPPSAGSNRTAYSQYESNFHTRGTKYVAASSCDAARCAELNFT